LKTLDGGATWIPTPIDHVLNSVFFINSDTGFAVGGNDYGNYNGVILKTTDAGATWNELSSGTTHPLRSVFFIDANTGFAVGDFGTIIKTTDGGNTWNSEQSGTIMPFYSVWFTNMNKGYVVGTDGIYKTLNGGLNWTADSSGTWNSFTSVCFTDSTTAYVVGASGCILKTGNGGTSSIETKQKVAEKFLLYPNPANQEIRITTLKRNQEEINIIIFKMNGEEILNQHYRNSSQVEIDVSMFLKGIYLVKIQDKEAAEVKKLMIE